MVAMDQRESLRTMFAAAGAGQVDDATLVAFKTAVARALAPLASGFLIDRRYGFDDLPAALAYQEQGHSAGKVVVTVT